MSSRKQNIMKDIALLILDKVFLKTVPTPSVLTSCHTSIIQLLGVNTEVVLHKDDLNDKNDK